MAMITEHEAQQVERANASGKTPVVFVHGLWLLPSSWDRWAALFEEAGYAALTPGWPDDPETVEEAKAHPEVFAHKTIEQVADHYCDVIAEAGQEAGRDRALLRRPGHPDHRRPRRCRRVGGDRPGAVPRRAAAADIRPQVGLAGPRQPGQPQPRGAAHLRPVPLRLRQRRRARTRPRSSTRPSRCRPRAGRSFRRRARTSTRGPRRRWTPRTPTVGRC